MPVEYLGINKATIPLAVRLSTRIEKLLVIPLPLLLLFF